MTPNLNLVMPLIGVIIGALIGATSSLTAGYFADKRKYRMDRIRLRLEKLERATSALNEVFDGCSNQLGATYLKARWNTELPPRTPEFKNAISQLSTMVTLYFPELREGHQEFVGKMGELAAAVFEMSAVYSGKNPGFAALTEEQKDKAVEYITTKAAAVLDAINALESEMQKIADDLSR